LKVTLVLLISSFLLTPAQAQEGGMPSWASLGPSSKAVTYKSNRRVVRAPVRVNQSTVAQASSRQTLPHPAGCPRRLFCGCGASVHLFGHVKAGLMLAANWLKFPPASPAPGMVAARRGHVFVIDRVLGNGMVMAYDYNSGGGRSHYHARSLAGYSVRNPKG
jgi:hypothetical protein